ALRIELEPVGKTVRLLRGDVVEDAARSERPVPLYFVAHPDLARRIRIRDVEILLVRREADPVGPRLVLAEGLELAVLDAVNPIELQFLLGIVVLLGEAVGRIREIEPTVRLERGVVRAVEALALVSVGEHDELVVRVEPRDAPVAVLANDEVSLP